MTDEALLISQLKNPQTKEKAFTQLVHEYQESLYWQIRRMVTCHDDADDVLQNTFLKAWSALDTFRGEAKVSTWLFRIAVNEAISFLEKSKKSTTVEDTAAITETLLSDPYFDGDETQAQLQEAIMQLPSKQQLVFNMKYFDEMTFNQMSDILGTSVGALKASYHHAVKKITDFFENRD